MEKQTYEEIVKPLLVDDTLPVIKWMQQIKLIPIQRQCHYKDIYIGPSIMAPMTDIAGCIVKRNVLATNRQSQ